MAAAEDDKGGAGVGKLTAAPSKLRTISFGIRSTAQKKKVAKLHTSLTTSISEEDPEDTEIKRAEPSFRRAVAKAEKSLAPGAGAPAAGVAKSMMATLIAAEEALGLKGAARRRATMQWANAKGGEMTATLKKVADHSTFKVGSYELVVWQTRTVTTTDDALEVKPTGKAARFWRVKKACSSLLEPTMTGTRLL